MVPEVLSDRLTAWRKKGWMSPRIAWGKCILISQLMGGFQRDSLAKKVKWIVKMTRKMMIDLENIKLLISSMHGHYGFLLQFNTQLV